MYLRMEVPNDTAPKMVPQSSEPSSRPGKLLPSDVYNSHWLTGVCQ